MKKILLLLSLIANNVSSQNLQETENIQHSSGWVNTLRKTFQAPFGNPNSLKDSVVSNYDTNCNLTRRSFYRRNSNNTLILISDYTYANYDTSGNFFQFIIQTFNNTTGASLSKFKTSYSYHQSNLLADTTFQEVSGTWNPAIAYQHFYTSSRPDSSYEFSYDTITTSWTISSKTYFTFVDTQNRPLKTIRYFLSGGTSYMLQRIDTMAYLNSTSNLLSYEKSIQYANNLPYTANTKVSSYDSYANLILSKTFLWNAPQTFETLIDSSLNYYLNPALKLVADSSYSYTFDISTGAFQLLLRGKNTFDANSNYINFNYEYASSPNGPFTPFVNIEYEWTACVPTLLPKLTRAPLLNFYPNPSNGKIILEGGVSYYEVYSVVGQLITSSTVSADQKIIEFTNLKSGVYFLRLGDGKNMQTKKLLIE